MSARVLLTGATGFLGGSILDRLVKHARRNSQVTILVRASAKAEGFRVLGVNAVVGSLDDFDLVERLASEADVVIQAASDHLLGTQALLSGCKKRFEMTGTPPAYIHTSSTGLMLDGAKGKFLSERIYSDLEVAMFEALPETPFRRTMDLVIEASKQGFVKSYLVIIPLLWGIVRNDFVKMGLQKATSIGLSFQASMIFFKGRGQLIGEGKNAWVHLNIEDAAEFYLVLVEAIISGKNLAYGREGYYCPENGSISLLRLSECMISVLFEHGSIKSRELVPWPQEELEGNILATMFGSNSISRGDRARSLGWKPKKDTDEFIGGIKEEVEYWLREHAHVAVDMSSLAAK